MAQDFQAAFHLSADDKHISVVDEGGVALAAIQGLNQKLEEAQRAVKARDGEIQTLKQENDSLSGRLSELEAAVRQLAARK
jgi:chromosome segregation ATPase